MSGSFQNSNGTLKKKKKRKSLTVYDFPCGTNLSLAAKDLRVPSLLLEKSMRLECVFMLGIPCGHTMELNPRSAQDCRSKLNYSLRNSNFQSQLY